MKELEHDSKLVIKIDPSEGGRDKIKLEVVKKLLNAHKLTYLSEWLDDSSYIVVGVDGKMSMCYNRSISTYEDETKYILSEKDVSSLHSVVREFFRKNSNSTSFCKGDVVRHRGSFSPRMVVYGIDGKEVQCSWMNNGELLRDNFCSHELTRSFRNDMSEDT